MPASGCRLERVEGCGVEAEPHVDRRAGVFTLEFAVLPLPREEPQWIANLGAEAPREIGAPRTPLETVPAANERRGIAGFERELIDERGASISRHGSSA